MKVRALALKNFGLGNLQHGQPVSDLNKVMVPIYLYHRYQTAAAAKLIGGQSFNYSVKGDGQPVAQIVPIDRQKAALRSVLATLDPKALDIKDETLNLLMPSLVSYSIADSERELFKRTAYPAFDVATAADTAADLTFDVLLHPRRAARLVEFKRRDKNNLGLMDVLQSTRQFVMRPAKKGRTAEIAKAVQARFVFALMDLGDSDVSPNVKARTDAMLRLVQSDLRQPNSGHGSWLVTKIDAHLNKAAKPHAVVTKSKPLPPGGPIGMGALTGGITSGQGGASNVGPLQTHETCWHCDPL